MPVESTTSAGGESGKRLALVVGVNHAPGSLLPLLRSARRDAEMMAHVLEKCCYFTLLEPPLLEEQATSAAVKKAILRLTQKRNANDFLLFYFSGHGQPMDVEAGRNVVYLGTHDFVEAQVEGDETLHLSFPWLRDKLYLQTEAGKVLLLLDCCYSGEMGRTGPDPYLEELQQRIRYYFEGPGAASGARSGGLRQALTATGHNAPAREGQVHGHMTGLMLPALRGEVPAVLGRQGQLTLLRLVDYLKESYEETPLPALSGDDAGQRCILASFQGDDVSRTAPLPAHTQPGHPASYLPFPRNPLFQPRVGEFERLEHLLFAAPVQQHPVRLGLVGVTGMGGVGKTQLAVELAYRYQHRFPGGIFWMPAAGHSVFNWQRTLADLAVKTNFLPPEDDPANPEHEALRARHLCRYFANHADALVILDNVEEPRLVSTALADLAGGALSCTILYTSRHPTPPAGATLYPVEPLSEEGALRLLLETTRPGLLKEVLAGSRSVEAQAVHEICRGVGYLPLALTQLQGLLEEDRQLHVDDLTTVLRQRGALALTRSPGQRSSLEETFQLSWQQVRDERTRQFFLLASLFPEAIPIPLWLAGLAAGLGESTRPFEPLWEVCLSLEESSLLERLSGDQVRLHPLVRAFGQRLVQREGEQGRVLRAVAGQRLLTAFSDLALLEQRARSTGYWSCLEQLRAARDYALLLDPHYAARLSLLERWLDRESFLLADERWWPETLPGLLYQQLFNRAVGAGEPLAGREPPASWIRLEAPAGADDQALLRIFAGHTDYVRSVAFSPDGQLVLTGSDDYTARLWETSSGKLLSTLQGHTFRVTSVAFSPDGRMILSGSMDGTARLWETSSGKLLSTLQGHTHAVNVSSVAFSPDGQLVLTGSSDGTARLWETSSGKLLSTSRAVPFSPDGRMILSGLMNKTARLWETSSGKFLSTSQRHTDYVTSVAFSPDGQLVLTGSSDGTARLWETSSGKLLSTSQVSGMAFSPDGQLVLTGSSDYTARLWEASSGKLLSTLQGHTHHVSSVAFSPDGQLVLTGAWDNTARLWETSSGKLLSTLHGHTYHVSSVAFSPDGQLVLTGSGDKTARLWKTSSGKAPATLQGHTNTIWSVAFSPDGQLVLTGSLDNTARLWETSSGKLLSTLHGHTNYVMSVAFSPDGQLVLTGSGDKTARLWETSSGKLLSTLQGHTSWIVSSVAFSPDGRLAMTGESDGRILFWRVLGVQRERPLGLYIIPSERVAVYWQDATHLLLAETGARGYPSIYRLSLEGPGWKSVEQAG